MAGNNIRENLSILRATWQRWFLITSVGSKFSCNFDGQFKYKYNYFQNFDCLR